MYLCFTIQELVVQISFSNTFCTFQSEEVYVKQSGISFTSISSSEESMAQTLVPKVSNFETTLFSCAKLTKPMC